MWLGDLLGQFMKKFRTHYDNLNVARNADIAVIKAAYKALAQKYHPDKNPNNPNAQKIMQVINKAYEVLSDPIKRAEHDRWIAEQERIHQTQNNQHQNTQNQTANQNSGNHYSSFYDDTGGQSRQKNQKDNAKNNNRTNTQKQYDYTNTNTNTHQNTRHHHSDNGQKHSHYHKTKSTVNKPSFWSLHGRMRRTTYILLSIPTLLLWVMMLVVTAGSDVRIIEMLLNYFLLFIGTKRLHDCDRRGWWMLIPFMFLIICFWRPTKGGNRFGADPRNNDMGDYDGDYEKDYFWVWMVAIGIFILVLGLSVLVLTILTNGATNTQEDTISSQEQIYQSDQSSYTPTFQSSYTPTFDFASDRVQTADFGEEIQPDPKAILAEAKNRYDDAVANINAVWKSLHPSTQDFLRDEQRVINKQREADCTAYGNAQSSDKDLAKAYRYLCEVLQLNERAEYLKTQLNTVVTPPEPKNVGPAYYQNQQSNQNGYHLNDLINDTVKKSLLFLDRDSASYDGYSHKLESQDITYADINNDSIKDAVVALRYCEVINCHTTTKSSELAVYLGLGDNQYLYGDIKTLGIDLTVYVDTLGNIYTQSKYYSEHEDTDCCPSMVVDNGFNFKNGKLRQMN